MNGNVFLVQIHQIDLDLGKLANPIFLKGETLLTDHVDELEMILD
jgi:hypothetical protein